MREDPNPEMLPALKVVAFIGFVTDITMEGPMFKGLGAGVAVMLIAVNAGSDPPPEGTPFPKIAGPVAG